MASLGTWPSSIVPMSARLVLQTNQRVNAAPGGGSEQAIDMLNDRWMCYLTLPVRRFSEAAAVEAFLASFRGQVNWVDLWHFARPTPQGSIAGSPTVSGAHAQGAALLAVQTTAGLTVKAGDMLGAEGLLLMAAADATADGAGVVSVPLVNRLRVGLSGGSAVTITQPMASFRLLSHTGVEYQRGITSEVSLTLGEKI
jgi:hypothetical protein